MRKFFRYSIYIMVVGLFSKTINAQIEKPVIDTSVFGKWARVDNGNISNNGLFCSYIVFDKPIGNKTLIIRETYGNWKVEFEGGYNAVFTSNSAKIIFTKPGDTLCILSLKTSQLESISLIKSFKLFGTGNYENICYQLKTSDKKFVLKNLSTGIEKAFFGVENYYLGPGGDMVLQTNINGNNISLQLIDWASCLNSNCTKKIIWEGNKVKDFVFDSNGSQLSFIGESTFNTQLRKDVFYYNVNSEKAVSIISDKYDGDSLFLDNVLGFSKNGTRLFYKIKELPYPKPKSEAVQLDVWNYKDIKLQSQQLQQLTPDLFGHNGPRSFLMAIDIKKQKIIRLEKKNEDVPSFGNTTINDCVILIENKGGDENEWYWNSASQEYFFLISTKTGEKKKLDVNYPAISPQGKYVYGTDSKTGDIKNNILIYDVSSNVTRNITANLPVPGLEEECFGLSSLKHRNLRVAGWLENDEAILVYDKYDIWQIDPSGKKAPVNLTQGKGRKKNIGFSLVPLFQKQINRKKTLILSAFNYNNKENGFYRLDLNNGNLELLTMGNYCYYAPSSRRGTQPLKALDSSIYLIKRETASESPNYFVTNNFRTYSPMSNVYPEKNYNWMKTELIKFRTVVGSIKSGILYKPEDFDSTNKYPLIIHYYEEMSDKLNSYDKPNATYDFINIPWFVSHGYLVFTPDISYEQSKPGKSAFNSVVGAAKYFEKLSWVDKNKIGIQGHSFGAYETNYIVTHTKIFAAAMSSSGVSNLISDYGSLVVSGQSSQFKCEEGQYRIGFHLWDNPLSYITNSPIFFADKVTTPLLMMNNQLDGAVPFAQGVEFFTALRRLGKRVWMLQYDGERHSLSNEKSEIDYTLRMTQFFDHYLKEAPAPRWMTQGIPAKLKGIETGYSLDPAANCGKDCKVCKMWNEKSKKDAEGTAEEVLEMENKKWELKKNTSANK